MRMTDILEKKRDGGELSRAELEFFVRGLTSGEIPNYQISAWLMAVYFRGMSDRELADITELMAHSGDVTDLTPLGDRTADKHSTGGVGDKTTLIVAPLVACLGGIVAKMSGRGLGFTGGTVDKLESIPGFRTELSSEEFLATAAAHGLCVVGQSGNLAPADKKLYALRDVTATVESIPLIASSVMSKKLAAGARSIVLDVKVGSGSFMKDIGSARLLAEKMTAIGKSAGRRMAAVLTNMDVPLGHAVGNSLEVAEAVRVLEGRGPADLAEVSLTLASHMLSLATGEEPGLARVRCERALADGSAKRKLCEMVLAQGGDASYIENPDRFPKAEIVTCVLSPCEGYLSHMNAEKIGAASSVLGAGREKKGDAVDHSAGIVLFRKTGEYVKRGETIAELHTSDRERVPEAESIFLAALAFSEEKPAPQKLIYDVIG
ncbi:MAG: thymidine phosphorylase [Clostridiales bacterium]|nr:thymidine phosphorylase [Clostridiales bacterium]